MGPKTISRTDQKIASIQLQTSAYGLAIPIGYGTNRVAGNLIWYGGFTPIAHTTKTSSGGKGLGKVTQKDTTYTYTAAVMMALGEGTIAGVRTVWKGKDMTSLAALGLTLFTGGTGQAAWSYLTSYVVASGTADYETAYGYGGQGITWSQPALNYSDTAYLAASAYDLGDNASIPNHGFEVQWSYRLAGGDDANPAAFTPDFLTNARYGASFPAASLGDLTAWSNYCLAAGLLFSPAYTEARPAADCLTDLTDASNTAIVWSEGLLKFVPYGDAALTGNGATYTPNLTPAYDLTDDDFLAEADADADPVVVTRSTPADAFNRVQVEFLNRANQYNVEIVTVEDQLAIEQFGLKVAPVIQMHFICDAGVAKIAAQLALQRYLYKRNTYAFKLGWQYDLLEPMDMVTLTDAGLGLAAYPVRLTSVEEDDSGTLSIEAEDFPLGVAAATRYPHDNGQRYQFQLNAAPQSAAAPVIFELPADPSATGLAVGIAAGRQLGDVLYGGCRVWLSLDGTNYKVAGTIYGSSRYGTTTAALGTATAGIDTSNTLAVTLRSSGQLLSGSAADVAKGTTLIRIGSEFLAYQTATLTGTNAYTLSTLNRGLWNTTPAAVASGATWVRVDDAIARLTDLDPKLVGQTVYVKLTAFNTYGAGEQDLASVTAYSYTITGGMKALKTPIDFDTGVGGSGKPADNAGTSGVLVPIGTGTTVQGNTVAKTTGTPGEQGGAVGSPLTGTIFVSSTILQSGGASGLVSRLALDDDATSYVYTSMNVFANVAEVAAGSGSASLYIGATSYSTSSNFSLSATSIMLLGYDGVTAFLMVDGVKVLSGPAAAGQKFWPKALDYYLYGQRSILYGPWSENTWASIGGPDKPTQITNEIPGPDDPSTWTLQNGAVVATVGSRKVAQLGAATAIARWAGFIKCNGGETKFERYVLTADATGADTCNASYTYQNADGSFGAVNLSDRSARTLSQVNAAGELAVEFSFVLPSTAMAYQPYIERPSAGSGGNFFASRAYAGRAQTGADVTAASQVTLTGPSTVRVAADNAGNPLADTTIAYKLIVGGTDRSADATWSIASSSGCSVSVSVGVVARTGALGANGKFTVRAALGGMNYDQPVAFIRDDALAPSGSGTGGSSGGGTSNSGEVASFGTSNAYGSVGAESAFPVTAGSAGTITFNGSFDYSITRTTNGPVSESGYGKVQINLGGTWTDVGSEVATDVAATYSKLSGDQSSGTITISGLTKTGLTSGTAYSCRLLWRRGSTASSVTAAVAGTLTGAGT